MFIFKTLRHLFLLTVFISTLTQISGCGGGGNGGETVSNQGDGDTSNQGSGVTNPTLGDPNILSGSGINADDFVKYRATVVKGLPKGVLVTGKAQMPKPAGDGSYFQIVDADALASNELTLSTPDGFMGDIDLTISVHHGDANDIQTTDFSQSFSIEPPSSGLLFAQSGSLQFDNAETDQRNTVTPLDIIVNPLLDPNGVVTISGFPEGAALFTRGPNPVDLVTDSGSIEIAIKDLKGLMVDVFDLTEGFLVDVVLSTTFDGKPVDASQSVFINVAKFSDAANGDKQLLIDGNRSGYTIERIANSLVVTDKLDSTQVIRVDMVKVKHIRFNDKIVSSRDFVQELDISDFVSAQANDISDSLVVISNVPAGAIVNNAVELGNGAFVIPASEIQDNAVDIDYSLINEEFTAEIAVRAYAGTEAQTEFLKGKGRATGYANAEAFAGLGFESALVVGPDGVSAEARAYAEAGAVATAGGSVVLEGVGSVSAEVSAEAIVKAEVVAQLTATNTEFSQEVGAEVESTASSSASVAIESDIIPGTRTEGEGTVGVTTFAKVGANQEVLFGDGNFGASGEAGAEAGIMATATGYASGSVGGVGGNAEGGVSAGLGVGASAGGTAKFEDGELTIGVSGELALLLGVEFDVELVIDTNEVAETAELIGNGVVTVAEAVEDGFIDAGTAISDFGLDAGEAIGSGLISATDALASGFIDVGSAVGSGFLSGADAVAGGFIDVSSAVGSGLLSGADAVAGGFIDVGSAVGSGLLSGTEAVAGGFIDVGSAIGSGVIDVGTAVSSGFLTGAQAVSGGFIDVGSAIGSGLLSGTEAVAGGLIDVGTAVSSGFLDVGTAIGSGFISGADAVAGGFISGADAVAGGFIDGAGSVIGGIGDVIGGIFGRPQPQL